MNYGTTTINQKVTFDDVNQPRVFVMAPRILQLTSDGDFSSSETAGGSRFKYNRHVNRILTELRTIFPKNNELTIPTVQYSPQQKWVHDDAADKDDYGDTMFNSHRGKLLIQYQPAPKRCDEAEEPKAMWRVWFEGHDIGDRHAEWVPADHQHLMRDERSCRIKAPTGTATPTTQGPAPAPPSPTPTKAQTDLPPSPPPPPSPKTCNLHLHEYVEGPEAISIKVDYDFYDGRDKPKHSGHFTRGWNEEYLVPTADTGLAHPISVTVTNQLPRGTFDLDYPSSERQGGGGVGKNTRKRCARTQWKTWVINLKCGELEWPSRASSNLLKQDPNVLPNCQVGGWAENDWDGADKVNAHRQMDCRFAC
ncbi:uncharacterized protein PG986_005576 [Apiospora aurea]|uniref:Uncharacterized protein n=1 Tax=Apiospora aurea TaxID=335848 RepID=A0ABR1QIC1_9PEZI